MRRYITFLKEAKCVSVLLHEIVPRSDPGQGQANNHCCRHMSVPGDGLRVSKVA